MVDVPRFARKLLSVRFLGSLLVLGKKLAFPLTKVESGCKKAVWTELFCEITVGVGFGEPEPVPLPFPAPVVLLVGKVQVPGFWEISPVPLLANTGEPVWLITASVMLKPY